MPEHGLIPENKAALDFQCYIITCGDESDLDGFYKTCWKPDATSAWKEFYELVLSHPAYDICMTYEAYYADGSYVSEYLFSRDQNH